MRDKLERKRKQEAEDRRDIHPKIFSGATSLLVVMSHSGVRYYFVNVLISIHP
jgi:hypothetical protein